MGKNKVIPIVGENVGYRLVGDVDKATNVPSDGEVQKIVGEFMAGEKKEEFEKASTPISEGDIKKLKDGGILDKKEIVYHSDEDDIRASRIAINAGRNGIYAGSDVEKSRVSVNNEYEKRGLVPNDKRSEYGRKIDENFKNFDKSFSAKMNEKKNSQAGLTGVFGVPGKNTDGNSSGNDTLLDLRYKLPEGFTDTKEALTNSGLVPMQPAGSHKVETVNHPKHYNLDDGPYIVVNGNKINIECIDVIRNMPTWKGNVIKYLWRCGVKQEQGMSPVEKELDDLEKALWYLQDKINEIKNNK